MYRFSWAYSTSRVILIKMKKILHSCFSFFLFCFVYFVKYFSASSFRPELEMGGNKKK